MSCEHYWREGILLVERGEPDPHRDACVVCRREHQAREELIRALPFVGGTQRGDRSWQAKVWKQLALLEPASPRWHWRWWLSSGLATALIAALVCWLIPRAGQPDDRPRIEVLRAEVMRGGAAMHPVAATVGDRVRIAVKPSEEVRIYRGGQLVLRCAAAAAGEGCASDAHGVVAEAVLAAVATYQLVVIRSATAPLVGALDLDLEAIRAAGGDYQITELSVL
jgi:hypothetical protein